MEDFKEEKVHYYESEIRHLEQKKHEYQLKVDFYTKKLEETRNEIVKNYRTIQDIKKEDYASKLRGLSEKFSENKEGIHDNMKSFSESSQEAQKIFIELLMERLKGEQ